MTKRRLKKIVKRAIYLPRGFDLFRYLTNKIYAFILTKSKSSKVAHPSTIMLEVTNHCNLKCITCPREYQYGDEMDKGYMDFDKLKLIVDDVYPYIDSIGLTGLGETFLYKEIVPAVEYIKSKSKGIIVSCSINAHLKNSIEITKQLVNKIDTIQISMDGIGDAYNSIRINADFIFFKSNLIEIVNLAKGTNTDIMLNVVLVEENYHQASDMIEFANELGIKYINMLPMNLVANTSIDISYYDLYFSGEYQREIESAKTLSQKYSDLEFTYSTMSKGDGFKSCKYPWNYFYISWDGFLPPCCAKPFPKEKNFGNVFEDGIMNSLNSKEFIKFRELWYKNETPKFCEKCSAV